MGVVIVKHLCGKSLCTKKASPPPFQRPSVTVPQRLSVTVPERLSVTVPEWLSVTVPPRLSVTVSGTNQDARRATKPVATKLQQNACSTVFTLRVFFTKVVYTKCLLYQGTYQTYQGTKKTRELVQLRMQECTVEGLGLRV